MARLNARSVKSRQNRVLRYVASTDIDKSAQDLGVSTNQLTRFLRAKPQTVQKHPERYRKLLETDTQAVAKEKDVKLVQRLSGKRLNKAYAYQTERSNRAVKLAKATREKRKVVEEGRTFYRPVNETKAKASRQQILTNMSGYSAKSIIELYHEGSLTESEAKRLMRKLFANSGVSASQADSYWEKAK